jgi:hypothetical protein
MRTIATILALGWHAIKWFLITTAVLWICIFALGASLAEASETNPPVKMSNSEICHATDSSYYNRTKNFTAYETLDECLEAGGRLPKNYTPKKDA